MARVKLHISGVPVFSTTITVRVTDLNYGKHLANDKLAGFLHEARVRYFADLGCPDDLNFFGTGLIQADLALEFKSEAFLAEHLRFELFIDEQSPRSFAVYYRISEEGSERIVALARTGMVAFDYTQRKVVPFTAATPEVFRISAV
jgi:acyl-CoA thioesterase FadM